jgi:hypothetical protein
MRRPGHGARLARFSIGVMLATIGLVLPAWSGTAPHAEALPAWAGGMDLYRSSAFSTQQSWLWCTAADVQIIRNLVDHEADHTRASQQRYFSYMRAHDRYAMPVSDGTEPSGWAAGLRRYVDGRYRVVQSTSFDAALRTAVTRLRKTSRPVGLLVAHGDHAWVLTGFTATADPARTARFTVTSVRVAGPLWGLQSRSYGYDMRPDTRLTPAQLRGFFTPWHYARIRMAWEGRWVAVQAMPSSSAPAATPATPHGTVKPASTPKPTRASGLVALPSPLPSVFDELDPTPASVVPVAAAVATIPAEPSPGPTDPTTSIADIGAATGLFLGVALLIVFVLAVTRAMGRSRRRTRPR